MESDLRDLWTNRTLKRASRALAFELEGRDHFAKHFPGKTSLAGRSREKLSTDLALH